MNFKSVYLLISIVEVMLGVNLNKVCNIGRRVIENMNELSLDYIKCVD